MVFLTFLSSKKMKSNEQLQAELESTQLAYAMAKEMSHFHATFLAKISHELRSPLSGIMGMHQLILGDLCDNPREEREFIAQAYGAAQKLIKLIDDIVVISKLEAERIKPSFRSVKLSDLLRQLEHFTQRQAANRNNTLAIMPLETEVEIWSDPKLCIQAMVLLLDAVISQVEKATIEISVSIDPASQQAKLLYEFPGNLSLWKHDPLADTQPLTTMTLADIKEGDRPTSPHPAFILMLAKKQFQYLHGDWRLNPENPDGVINLVGTVPLQSPEPQN